MLVQRVAMPAAVESWTVLGDDDIPIELALSAKPGQQRPVAGRCRGELGVGYLATDLVDHRDVVGLAAGVHSAGDRAQGICHAGSRRPFRLRLGRHASGRARRTTQ